MSKNDQIDDGGPAFPNGECSGCGTDHAPVKHLFMGMSLRDWFAGQAMQAIIAKTPFVDMTAPSRESAQQHDKTVERLVATTQGAYLYADAMLSARKSGVSQ